MIIYFCKRPLRVFGKKVGGFSAGSFSGLCVLQLLWRMPHAQANNMLTGIALPSTRCLVIRAHSSCNFLCESWFPPFSYSAIAIIVAQDLLSVPSLNTHLLSSRLWEGAKVPSNFPNLAYHLEIGSNFKSVELSSTFLAGVKGLAHVQWFDCLHQFWSCALKHIMHHPKNKWQRLCKPCFLEFFTSDAIHLQAKSHPSSKHSEMSESSQWQSFEIKNATEDTKSISCKDKWSKAV